MDLMCKWDQIMSFFMSSIVSFFFTRLSLPPCLAVSPFFSLWAPSSDGFWPTFGCRELQCVWAKSQHGFTARTRERWRDRECERQRMVKIMSNEIEIQLCAVSILSLPLHLWHFLQIWSDSFYVPESYLTIIPIILVKVIITSIRNTFNERFICIWSFLFVAVKPIALEPDNSHIWH